MKEYNVHDFDSLICYLGTIPNINLGGCGISALAMYLWLEQNGQLCEGDSVVYLYRCWAEDSYENNKKLVETNLGRYASGCSHAVLRHDGKIYDSEGLFGRVCDYGFAHELPTSLVLMTLKVDDWNPDFDRDYYLPKIEKKLNIKII